jgi:predicted polyphosphate/ATP-dependent NAD kinase
MKRIGLIVNPVAGLGGRVGLKGSDGRLIQVRARELGAVPHALDRTVQALQALKSSSQEFELFAYPSEMGAEAARLAGLSVQVLGAIRPGQTTAEDTRHAAELMLQNKVDLLLFAGGDGTARDVCKVIGTQVPALGIPAGVKIQSAVFATHPRTAGELTAAFLRENVEFHLAEVVDLDEDAYRLGRLSARLYGYLKIPYSTQYLQGGKTATPLSESAVCRDIAADLAERLQSGWLYIWGPGSTTQAVAAHLGIQKTLLGVDAVVDGKIMAADAGESDLLSLLAETEQAGIIVTPIGGQGCLFGRGNQPISPQVIQAVGRSHIRVIATPGKIQRLQGASLWVDTGDVEVDRILMGYMQVLTGYKESIMVKVSA